jgi:hypothetical protein
MTTIPNDYDHGGDEVVRSIVMALSDSFHDLDDCDDLPFGGFARTEFDPATASPSSNVLIVRHETDDVPAVRITVERIA